MSRFQQVQDALLKTLFGRHKVRSSFYHLVSGIFLISMILWAGGIIPDNVSTIIGMILFTVDYLAEMYDPNPNNPGPWFTSHFHRFFDGKEVEDIEECEFMMLYNKVHNNPEFDKVFEKINVSTDGSDSLSV